MRDYGDYGRPVMLFEAYIDWREHMKQLAESNAGTELAEADTKWDFPSFMFGPVRQSMWHGYERVQPQYRRYARVESAPDFRERRLRGLTGMSKPGYIGDLGEAPPMTRGERPPATLVVDTYGGVYSMSRHLIINDDTNELLNSAPDEMGEAASEFIVETIVALVESNPTAPDGDPMWTVGRGNQITDALSEQSLALGISRMTKQRDDTNRRISVRVATLLLGDPQQAWIADRIINSTETGTVTNDSATTAFDKGRRNPIARALPNDAVVYDAYLSDANDWYLFADPNRVPAFAVGFLNGQERPQVMLKNPEVRNVLGGGGQDPYTFEMRTIDWLVQFDFGVAPVDPRGTFRSVVA